MKFTVFWSQDAYQSLAELLRTRTDTDEILQAVGAIQDALRESPDMKGESRDSGRRILVSPPLVASFQVRWCLAEVLVGKVWAFHHNCTF